MDTAKAIGNRWSPREYTSESFPDAQLREIFEAHRAAHSCFNEQPWRYLFAKKNAGAPREQLEALLDEGNAFAKQAWILGLTVAARDFKKTGKPNRHSGHDLGAASALMSLQAFSMGISMRFMAGFNLEAARKIVGAEHEPYAMFVMGVKSPDLEVPIRTRNDLSHSVFENTWGKPWKG